MQNLIFCAVGYAVSQRDSLEDCFALFAALKIEYLKRYSGNTDLKYFI